MMMTECVLLDTDLLYTRIKGTIKIARARTETPILLAITTEEMLAPTDRGFNQGSRLVFYQAPGTAKAEWATMKGKLHLL